LKSAEEAAAARQEQADTALANVREGYK
jgi:hypothetical protein